MKKLFFLLISAILITGCASTRKNGCDYGTPKKSYRTVPRGFLSLILVLLFSLSANSQKRKYRSQGDPMNIQVRVDTIFSRTAFTVDLRGISLNGDTVFIRWGSSRSQIRQVKVGAWFTIHGCKCDPAGQWVSRKIRLNR